MDGSYVHVGFGGGLLASLSCLLLDDPVMVATFHLGDLREVVLRRRGRDSPFDPGGVPWVVACIGFLLGTSEEIDDEDHERDEKYDVSQG